MARLLHVYPKALIKGSLWTLTMKVYEPATKVNSRFVHTVPAGVTAETPLMLLKLVFDVVVGDADTAQDVDDALFVDDIKPGQQTATVWGNWADRAEGIISGLASGYTVGDFWGDWSKQDTSKVRNDARKALVQQRGWTVPVGSIHQHEGDGTNTDE